MEYGRGVRGSRMRACFGDEKRDLARLTHESDGLHKLPRFFILKKGVFIHTADKRPHPSLKTGMSIFYYGTLLGLSCLVIHLR